MPHLLLWHLMDSLNYPFKAIWRNADFDTPVVIVGSYGVLDGEEWLKLESGTGVKKSEIIIDKPSFWRKVWRAVAE